MDKNGQSIEEYSSKQIKNGALLSYILLALSMAAGLLYTPWMIRCIGQSDYGLYTLASSLVSLFLVDFGMSQAVSRYVSKYLSEGDREAVNGIVAIISKILLGIACVIFLILAVLYFHIETLYAELTPAEVRRFRIVYLVTGFYNVVSFPFLSLNGIMTSFEKFTEEKLIVLFNKLATILLMIAALSLGGGLYALVLVNAFCGVLTTLARYLVVRKTGVKPDWGKRDKRLIGDILGFSLWSTVISMTERLIFNIMPSILAAASGALNVAVFGIASTLEGYVYSFSDGINGLFLPKTARIVASSDRDEKLLRLMVKVGRVNLLVVALVVVGFLCAGREFVILWMGPGYSNAYYCAVLMILPDVFYAPQQIGRTALVAENKLRYQAVVYLIIGLANVVIASVLTRYLDELGAGISIGIVYTLRLALMSTLFSRKLGLKMSSFYRQCHLQMLLPILVTLVLGLALFRFTPIRGWLFFVGKCGVLAALYAVLMWSLCMNEFEKELVRKAWRRLRRA